MSDQSERLKAIGEYLEKMTAAPWSAIVAKTLIHIETDLDNPIGGGIPIGTKCFDSSIKGEDDGEKFIPTEEEMKLLSSLLSNKEINRAGDVLVAWMNHNDEEKDKAIDNISEYRQTFAYPLRCVSTILRKMALAVDCHATVYGRSKRMISIMMKLIRYPNMRLTTMQDIAGCRAVVTDMNAVNELVLQFREIAPQLESPEENNYIEHPKPDGYRSVHFVVRYLSRNPLFKEMPNRRIEIQIRSRLQHQWAAALETIDLFTEQTLKVGGGAPKWKRFFLLTSSLLAIKENSPVAAGTPTDKYDVLREVRRLWDDLRVTYHLNVWTQVVLTDIPSEHGKNAMYLIETNFDEKTTAVKSYENTLQAYSEYKAAELRNKEDPSRTAVLVSAFSVNQLKAAFPSYYGDAQAFLGLIEQELRENRI